MIELSIATDEAIMNDSYIQHDAMHLHNIFHRNWSRHCKTKHQDVSRSASIYACVAVCIVKIDQSTYRPLNRYDSYNQSSAIFKDQ